MSRAPGPWASTIAVALLLVPGGGAPPQASPSPSGAADARSAAVLAVSPVPSLAGEWSGPAGIRVRVREADDLAAALRAIERVLDTPIGARVRARLRAVPAGDAVVVELNRSGDNFTRYRVPGETLGRTIAFDPDARPRVETERGPEAAPPETVLAHELGHALFGLRSEDAVIREVENPVRVALGLPRRVRF